MNFAHRVRAHLSRYAYEAGPREQGIWKGNGKRYPHILPEGKQALNILEPYRDAFWKSVHGKAKLHQDFHHLNSSQALCFNLFAPFLLDGQHALLYDILDVGFSGSESGPRDCGFERVFETAENTNFDLFLQPDLDTRLYFEVKYTENGFGTAPDDERHRDKLETIYRPRLAGKVVPGCLEAPMFFQNYQIHFLLAREVPFRRRRYCATMRARSPLTLPVPGVDFS